MHDISKTSKQWVLGGTSLVAFMAALDALVVTTALVSIRQDFAVSLETLQWVTNAYNLSFAVLLLTGAALGDRLGRRRMFLAGIAVFMLSSIACALAPTIGLLIAGRVAQGAGAALIMPLAMTLLSASTSSDERAKALGIFSGIVGFALIAGPSTGGAITQAFGWKWIFWINIPIGLVAIAIVVARFQESFGPAAKLDLIGLIIVAAAAFSLVWALLRGNIAGWTSGEVAIFAVLGVFLSAAFIVWEISVAQPMVPMRLFQAPAFSGGIIASAFFYAAMYGVLFLLPQFFSVALGYGPLTAGVGLLSWTATLFVAAPLSGRVVNRIGERPIVVTGTLLQALGFLWIALIVPHGVAYHELVVPLIAAGAGVSMAMPAVQNAILGAVAPAEMGKASGIFNMARFLGGMFGVALLVAVFAARTTASSASAFADAFSSALLAAAALSFCGAIAGLWLPPRPRLAAAQAQA
jgi:EmrB/QacA subfamily drug resistance transporter